MFRTVVCAGLLACISNNGFAQQQTDSTKVQLLDEVVISDSRFSLSKEKSGKVITKIDQKQLERLQGKSIAEIINATVGIEINGTKSNPAQNLGYFVRGGRNRQVLVMIDGVALTDPSQIANDYDLRLLNTDQVESIEILKGASSTLYGTGAATAVINIKLKEEANKPIAATFRSTMGTNESQTDQNYRLNHFMNSVAVNGTLDKFSYLTSFGHRFTDGISAVENGTEEDAFNSYNAYLKLGYRFSNQFKLSAYANLDRFKAEFDDAFALMDADNLSETKQERVGLSSEWDYGAGNLTMNAAYNDVRRDINSSFPSQFNSESYIADVFNRYVIKEKFYTVLGINFQENKMESFSIPFGETNFSQSIDPEMATFNIIDPYINGVYASDFGLNINAGARLNNHSEYGSHLVYNVNPSYVFRTSFGYLKGLASYSTSYITPSLFQLFEPSFGNPELEPEENRTIELGAELNLTKKLNLSVVYFNRLEENFVDFVDLGDFVFQYTNTAEEFTASGLEVVFDYQIFQAFKLRTNGTYTHVDEDLDLRIPKLKINAALDYQVGENTFMSLAYQYNDERNDSFFNNETFENEQVILDSYGLLDFYVSQKVLKNKMTLFANVNNILNETYNELFGFATRGRTVNLGFTLSL